MQLVHRRVSILPHIWEQLPGLGCPVHLGITLSRPTAEVIEKIQELVDRGLGKRVSISLHNAPFSPLGERERWMELRQLQLEWLPRDCTHGVIWDDDHILEDKKELVEAIDEGADLTYITKLFFWDSPKTYTTTFPDHNSVFSFRMLPGDRFPLDRTIHAPAAIHDRAKKVVQLKGRLLDYGYMDAYDRATCWAEYKQAGKIDAATRPLVMPPNLVEWRGINPFEKT